MMEIYILGTSASIPTRRRGLPGVLMNYKGDRLLFDCGEGTQRTIMANNLGLMKIKSVFITHWHADHFAGLIGLIQTMGMEKRKKPLFVYGPKGTEESVKRLMSIGHYRLKYQVVSKDLDEGDVVEEKTGEFEYSIIPFTTKHDCASLGYVFQEKDELKVNRKKMDKLGLKSSPLIGKLKRGEEVIFKEKKIKPSDVVDKVYGRKVVYTGDTESFRNIVKFSKGADVLIHDSTYSKDSKDEKNGHSSAEEAGKNAKLAKVKKLVLTHLGRKFDNNPDYLLKEAERVFKSVEVAEDLLKIELMPNRPE